MRTVGRKTVNRFGSSATRCGVVSLVLVVVGLGSSARAATWFFDNFEAAGESGASYVNQPSFPTLWQMGKQIFTSSGSFTGQQYYGYYPNGPYQGPNAIELGQGGLDQGLFQAKVYPDYGYAPDWTNNKVVHTLLFVDRVLTLSDVASSRVKMDFSFKLQPTVGPNTQAFGWIKVLSPNYSETWASDTLSLTGGNWGGGSVAVNLSGSAVGAHLQWGFTVTSQNYEPNGLFFDNVLVADAPPSTITINVASGTQTQSQAGYPLLSGATPVVKTGAGTAVFNAANTLTGPTTVSQGALQLGSANALSSSAVTVAAGAKLTVGPQVAAVVPALVNNGLVDVGLGGLTISAGQNAAGIVAGIVAGRNNGLWNGTAGITSSAAATQSERAVGWLDNGDGSYTVAFAAAGDWNLNGVVDFDDVVQFVSANLYDTGLPATWAEGDFDYNGVVDFDDVVASVSANLFDAGPYNTAPSGLSALGGGGIAAVPEPAAWVLAVFGVVASGALVRRRTAR